MSANTTLPDQMFEPVTDGDGTYNATSHEEPHPPESIAFVGGPQPDSLEASGSPSLTVQPF